MWYTALYKQGVDEGCMALRSGLRHSSQWPPVMCARGRGWILCPLCYQNCYSVSVCVPDVQMSTLLSNKNEDLGNQGRINGRALVEGTLIYCRYKWQTANCVAQSVTDLKIFWMLAFSFLFDKSVELWVPNVVRWMCIWEVWVCDECEWEVRAHIAGGPLWNVTQSTPQRYATLVHTLFVQCCISHTACSLALLALLLSRVLVHSSTKHESHFSHTLLLLMIWLHANLFAMRRDPAQVRADIREDGWMFRIGARLWTVQKWIFLFW
jgi:hypothetical protein